VTVIGETSISIRHNMETAHRLFLTKGKCQQIHGHSFWVDLELVGEVDDRGMVAGTDFGEAKRMFRDFLDQNFDHKTLLNQNDPWAGEVIFANDLETRAKLPGLVPTVEDPTTENIAMWIATWAIQNYSWDIQHVVVKVQETAVNAAAISMSR
jgi:6-pyruvoyl tetrahydropterin synthase/QueD family protein